MQTLCPNCSKSLCPNCKIEAPDYHTNRYTCRKEKGEKKFRVQIIPTFPYGHSNFDLLIFIKGTTSSTILVSHSLVPEIYSERPSLDPPPILLATVNSYLCYPFQPNQIYMSLHIQESLKTTLGENKSLVFWPLLMRILITFIN